MPENTQFRIALHGFNREDVVTFIDRMSRDHEDDMQRLRTENDKLQAELERTRDELAASDHTEAEQALNEARAEIGNLRTRNEALEQEISELKAELEAARAEVQTAPAAAPQDLAEPIPPLAEVLPAEIQPSKDYTELELAAYRRAELTERLARERSADVYRQVQSVFAQANARLDTGRADLENLSRALTADVNEMLTLLTNLNSAYRQAEISFGEIGARNREILEGND